MIAGTIAMWVLALRVVRDDFTLPEVWQKRAFLVSCIIITVLLVFVMFAAVFSQLVSAAENSAPTESAITVKGTSCPTEFDPEDLGWAMHEEGRENKKIQDTILVVVEHRRIFSYFPDPEQRILVGLKKLENPDCVAELFSYGSASGVDQKRVWGAIQRPTDKEIPIFLLTEKGWEKGNRLRISFDNAKLVFTLYLGEIVITSRELAIN